MTGGGPPGPRQAGPDHRDVARVLAEPWRLGAWFQPIVDTVTGEAAGFEALSRFTGQDGSPSRWGPAGWFAAAHDAGLGAPLEALALDHALRSLPGLPADTFLTANVSPAAITSCEVADVLAGHPDLGRVIVEITETEAVEDVRQVSSVCAGIRAAGGTVAVDDAGAGYAGLALIAQLRPQLVKVDRELVAGCDADPVRASLIEVLGVWASGMDARLLAEGVETAGEYATVVGLGVPLVQGWFTGRAAPLPTGPAADVTAELRRQRARVELRDSVASVMAVWPVLQVDGDALDPRDHRDPRPVGPAAVAHVLADKGWPVALVRPRTDGTDGTDGTTVCPVSLRVRPSEDVRETLRRALARPPERRYDPVVVTDPQGWTVGVVTIEALVTLLLAA